MQKPYTFIFVGRSGSGKGTQSDLIQKLITEKYNEPIYSFVTGGVLRDFMKDGGYAQDKIREIMNKGILVPDIITCSLFSVDLLKKLDKNDHLFIDAIPRSVTQSEAVMAMLAFYERPNPVIIDISVSAEEAKKRMLSRKRSDDNEESILGRMAFYEEHVVPAVEFLKEKSGYKYIEIDGMPDIETIQQDLLKKLEL